MRSSLVNILHELQKDYKGEPIKCWRRAPPCPHGVLFGTLAVVRHIAERSSRVQFFRREGGVETCLGVEGHATMLFFATDFSGGTEKSRACRKKSRASQKSRAPPQQKSLPTKKSFSTPTKVAASQKKIPQPRKGRKYSPEARGVPCISCLISWKRFQGVGPGSRRGRWPEKSTPLPKKSMLPRKSRSPKKVTAPSRKSRKFSGSPLLPPKSHCRSFYRVYRLSRTLSGLGGPKNFI